MLAARLRALLEVDASRRFAGESIPAAVPAGVPRLLAWAALADDTEGAPSRRAGDRHRRPAPLALLLARRQAAAAIAPFLPLLGALLAGGRGAAMIETFDAVVIGSGFGGSADGPSPGRRRPHRLPAGARAAPIRRERSRARPTRWRATSGARRTAFTGSLQDVHLSRRLITVTAAGLGGGSLIYAERDAKEGGAILHRGGSVVGGATGPGR